MVRSINKYRQKKILLLGITGQVREKSCTLLDFTHLLHKYLFFSFFARAQCFNTITCPWNTQKLQFHFQFLLIHLQLFACNHVDQCKVHCGGINDCYLFLPSV